VSDETLHEQLSRLERERTEADERYNDALTALDRALSPPASWPDPPPLPDVSSLANVSRLWDIAPTPPSSADRSIKGRLRTFVWRMIGPPLEAQRAFNGSVAEHAARAATAQSATHAVIEELLAALRAQGDARVRFESHLIHYLQTITWYVDTRDRAAGGQALVLNAGLSAIADDWMKRWESLATRETRFSQQVQQVLASLDDVRATSSLAQQTSLSLKRDVEHLAEHATGDGARGGGSHQGAGPTTMAARPDLDAFKYVSFENQFRGSPDEIRTRLEAYLPRFQGRADVLELGCGRGEFLDLLRAHGISARGLDTNEAMVRETRARGLDAVRADALEYLSDLPDGSLGGVFAAQVVEHLPPDYLGRLVETAAHKLRAGGIIVLETINPTCWLAFFESYIRDFTHVRPLHPETLQFLLRVNGFQRVEIEFKSPVPETQRLEALPWRVTLPDPLTQDAVQAVVDRMNAHAQTLNARLFGWQDYAVIGEK
jgi:O-antigen chain-terminating methyltransferase